MRCSLLFKKVAVERGRGPKNDLHTVFNPPPLNEFYGSGPAGILMCAAIAIAHFSLGNSRHDNVVSVGESAVAVSVGWRCGGRDPNYRLAM